MRGTTEVHYNGRTGLEAALNNEWDAILLDLMLPELNGLEYVAVFAK